MLSSFRLPLRVKAGNRYTKPAWQKTAQDVAKARNCLAAPKRYGKDVAGYATIQAETCHVKEFIDAV